MGRDFAKRGPFSERLEQAQLGSVAAVFQNERLNLAKKREAASSISEHSIAVTQQCRKSNLILGIFRSGIRESTKVAIF